MQKKSKISIVTISYNQVKYLEECIISVLNQNYENLEYIIVDAGSTDGSRELINSYKSSFSKIIFEKDRGPADGLNKGFSHATGEILCYLNSDDILYSGAFNEVNNIFQKNKKIDVVNGHGYYINKKGKKIKKIFSSKFTLKNYLYENCIVIQQSSFFRSSIYKKTKGFNLNNKIAWDGELMLDFFKANGKFMVVQRFWSGFRIYDNSISGSSNYRNNLMQDYARLRRLNNLKYPFFIKRKFFWFVNWISQPVTLFYRVVSVLEKY